MTRSPGGERALQRLLDGNLRFAEGRPEHPHTSPDRREELAERQRPFAAVVGCSDSRVPIERVFDQGLGDLFCVRVAGNVASSAGIGSVEYAVTVLGVELVVVLGHEACGAVQAAIDGEGPTKHVEGILAEIRPALEEARRQGGDLLETAVRRHAANVAAALAARSEPLRERVADGRLMIVPLVYGLQTGRVERVE